MRSIVRKLLPEAPMAHHGHCIVALSEMGQFTDTQVKRYSAACTSAWHSRLQITQTRACLPTDEFCRRTRAVPETAILEA